MATLLKHLPTQLFAMKKTFKFKINTDWQKSRQCADNLYVSNNSATWQAFQWQSILLIWKIYGLGLITSAHPLPLHKVVQRSPGSCMVSRHPSGWRKTSRRVLFCRERKKKSRKKVKLLWVCVRAFVSVFSVHSHGNEHRLRLPVMIVVSLISQQRARCGTWMTIFNLWIFSICVYFASHKTTWKLIAGK